ncbi:MAG TPA: glycoside hydrolase family 3 C-terminal domain-containing protein, partial [Spirochaetia bacterium]|nr:glycoside hydrolase family 3 C-terminal domain-containing protein [Spirochaetia bacterium]
GEEARGFYRRDPKKNGLTLWAPTVDLERDPRWGRTEEAYGEDPLLVAETAGALVRGIQGSHPTYLRAGATLKHFLGNNHEKDRGTVSVTLDPRNLHEYYQDSFRRIFRKAKAVSMMTAYNAVNGIPCNLHPDVLARAKREWGCAFVVSDAGDVVGTNREHKWFKTLAEAVAANLKAGIDSLTDDPEVCLLAVHEALGTGLLAESDVEEAVRNSLRVRFRFGEFDPAGACPYEGLGEEQIGSEAHRRVSREAAEKSLVLLKNDGILPLAPQKDPKIAVVGPLAGVLLRDWYSGEPTRRATVASALGELWGRDVVVEPGSDLVRFKVAGVGPVAPGADGRLVAGSDEATVFRLEDWGWAAHTLQDPATGLYLTTDDHHLTVSAKEVFGWFTKEVFLLDRQDGPQVTLATWNGLPVQVGAGDRLEVPARHNLDPGRIGIDAGTAGPGALTAVKGLGGPFTLETVEPGRERAVAAAKAADVAVVVVGCHPLVNAKETLDRSSLELPQAQAALVRAVAEANPRTVVVLVSGYPYALDAILDQVPAIVHTTHAGPEMGPAVAGLLAGKVNPAGRTCLTWYGRDEVLPALTDYDVMRSGRTYRWFAGRAQFPFGHGLSYSRFEYLDIQAAPAPLGLKVKVRVANASSLPGEEVVQVYATLQGTVAHPRRQLVAFRRAPFGAGETQILDFDVPWEDLRHWDPARARWVLDAGQVLVSAGPSSGDLRVSVPFPVSGEGPALRDLGVPTPVSGWDDVEEAVLDFCREGGSAATFGWAAFHHCTAESPRVWEVRVSSVLGGALSLHLDRPDGPVVARIPVPAARSGEVWRTLTAPVTQWPAAGARSVYLVSDLAPGREQGTSWFRLGS